ncbi:MAG TPA: DNA mismatch repair protein MutS, partial [Alphaproteobacteria bacterium]|nr:DNA mismatch repair protein MutS [Alphaproteobacteria bacterium]
MSTQSAEPEETPRRGAIATPAMARYLELKTENPGYLLFYRMGDFYELFFDDAEKAAAALDIALTKRGRHLGEDIKMCGVPVHAADSYLQRLIAKGFKVAVCEQMEDPAEVKRRGSKAPIARDVVRLVTPGTLTEDSLLEARTNNFLVAIAGAGRPSDASLPQLALGWLDISTGDFAAAPTSAKSLAADLARLSPAEILVSERLIELPELGGIIALQPATISVQLQAHFDSSGGEDRLHALFGVSSLDGFGNFSRAEIAALGALVRYIDETQKGRLPAIKPPRAEGGDALLALDPSTRANLELMQSLSGERQGSLLAAVDRTVTNGGARLLAGRLASPSAEVKTIDARLDAVGTLVENKELRAALRARLRATPDLSRALARLALGRGGPRDLAHVRDALTGAVEISVLLTQNPEPAVFNAINAYGGELVSASERLQPPAEINDLRRELERALGPELPLFARDGGFVREAYDEKLDETRALRDQSRTVLARLESKYREMSEVNSLRVKYNNVLGYFIEVTAANQAKLMSPPLSETFIHRQTLAGAYRFTTVELNELASRILDAGARALTLELEIFERLVSRVVAASPTLHTIAEALAIADVAQGFATLAVDADYARPQINDTLAFRIESGRHPVVELAMRARGEPKGFIGNDCDLSGGEGGTRILLVTGPNMAGKSTYLRQNALIAILAQTGSFVPAKFAEIGIIDRIFSRVGASDDLARGRSTFMVEMIEAAAILNQATSRSLVILDEIGRGTATYDGLAIAWAALEHLHEENRARALFATHYHELTVLKERLRALKPVTMRVSEWKGDIVFLHEVVPGAADRSYGIQVAKLAGVPESVTSRADAILSELERQGEAKSLKLKIDDLPLFRAARAPAPKQSEISQTLTALDLDSLSPREALETL